MRYNKVNEIRALAICADIKRAFLFEDRMEKTAYTKLLEHIASVGERENDLGKRVQEIYDNIRRLTAEYENAVMNGDDAAAESEAEIQRLNEEAENLDRRREILSRNEKSPTAATLAQAVVDENRGRISMMQADYDAQLQEVNQARETYLANLATLGEIAKAGGRLRSEVSQATHYLAPPKPHVALREAGMDRLAISETQFKTTYGVEK